MKYQPVLIEAVYPDGTVMVRNAFNNENASVRGEDPTWPRKRLVELAANTMGRWIETYGYHPARLRLVK
jgi:hypothetical protein